VSAMTRVANHPDPLMPSNARTGISLIFMGTDMAGGVFCTLSLAFRSKVDIIGTASHKVPKQDTPSRRNR
jgi:hypothetical protein